MGRLREGAKASGKTARCTNFPGGPWFSAPLVLSGAAAYTDAMHQRVTIASEIERLLVSLGGQRICDDCITDQLNLSVRSQANVVTRKLGAPLYSRTKAPCGTCRRTKTVTSWTG